MSQAEYIAVVHREDDRYLAYCPEVGTVAYGETIENALDLLQTYTEQRLYEYARPDHGRPMLTTITVTKMKRKTEADHSGMQDALAHEPEEASKIEHAITEELVAPATAQDEQSLESEDETEVIDTVESAETDAEPVGESTPTPVEPEPVATDSPDPKVQDSSELDALAKVEANNGTRKQADPSNEDLTTTEEASSTDEPFTDEASSSSDDQPIEDEVSFEILDHSSGQEPEQQPEEDEFTDAPEVEAVATDDTPSEPEPVEDPTFTDTESGSSRVDSLTNEVPDPEGNEESDTASELAHSFEPESISPEAQSVTDESEIAQDPDQEVPWETDSLESELEMPTPPLFSADDFADENIRPSESKTSESKTQTSPTKVKKKKPVAEEAQIQMELF